MRQNPGSFKIIDVKPSLIAGQPVSPPVAPPLPPGMERLRPNQDITVRYWKPRPVFLQLNEELILDNPTSNPSSISAPAVVEIFDAGTGCHQEPQRPRIEIGLTDPISTGPWEALQLRFRAVRSRPPRPERFPSIPSSTPQLPAPRDCPGTVTVRPLKSDRIGGWQKPSLEAILDQPFDSPDLNKYISSLVLDPPLDLARIETEKLPGWEPGWRRIAAKILARIRPALVKSNVSVLGSVTGNVVVWSGSTGLTDPAPGDYHVQWNPFKSDSTLDALILSDQQIWGMAQLSSDVNITANVSVNTFTGDHLFAEISADDLNYGSSVAVRIPPSGSITLYYRITISQGGVSLAGSYQVALQLEITGPDFTIAPQLMFAPDNVSPFVVAVNQIDQVVPLESRARLQVSLRGNTKFALAPIQYTSLLIPGWLRYELVWDGFWDYQSIEDLHFDIQAVPVNIGNDTPYIDISSFIGEVTAHCPGLDPPYVSRPGSLPVTLLPSADLNVVAWNPPPLFNRLLSDIQFVPADFIQVDPRLNNNFLVKIQSLPPLSPVRSGYVREWMRINLRFVAHAYATGSTSARLSVSTSFGYEQFTDILQTRPLLYSMTWDYPEGLSSDQINRLEVNIQAQTVVRGADEATVFIRALRVIATYFDVTTGFSPGSPPPPAPPSYITVLDPLGEVYSCGSLGDCSVNSVGSLLGRAIVNNTSSSNLTVNFVPGDVIHIRVFDTNTPSTEYPLSYILPANTSIHCSIFGWIGDLNNPYPVNPAESWVMISADDGTSVQARAISWFYIGF
jgi:hypothetical protein